jgi:hypothetical protein
MIHTKDNRTGRALVLTARDIRLLADVAQFRVLSRHQLMRLGHFRSKTRANAVLLRLVGAGYLSRRYQPAVAGTQRALYFLGPKGVALSRPGRPNTEWRQLSSISDLFLAHQLSVTDVLIAFRASPCRVERWMVDEDLRSLNLGILPDGHLEYELAGKQFGAFLELDRGTETQGRFRAKVEAYARLAQSGRYRSAFGRQFFRVLVVSSSDERLDHLRATTASVTEKIFWFVTLQQVVAEGPFARIWLRPVEPQRHALTEP